MRSALRGTAHRTEGATREFQHRRHHARPLPVTRRPAVRAVGGGDLPQTPQPDRAADGHRANAAGRQPELRGLLALPRRYAGPGVRVLHPHGGGGRVCDRAGDPGGAVPQPRDDRRRRPRCIERLTRATMASISLNLLLTVALAPLVGAVVAGLFGSKVGRKGAHRVTILGMWVSFIASTIVLWQVAVGGARFNATVYE